MNKEKIQKLYNLMHSIPDFPKPGILFRDVTGVLVSGDALCDAIDACSDCVENIDYDLVVGMESRGFLFSTPLAYKHRKGHVLARKPGKLPRETVSQEFELEYAKATFQLQKDDVKPGQRIVIVDDLLATGGTAEAVAKLVEKLGGVVVKIIFFAELIGLGGRDKLAKYDVESILQYPAH